MINNPKNQFLVAIVQYLFKTLTFFTFGVAIAPQQLRYQRLAVYKYSGVIDALLLQFSDDVNNTG